MQLAQVEGKRVALSSQDRAVAHPLIPKSVAGRATLPSSIAASTRCHRARASWSCRAYSHSLAQQAILARQVPPSRAAQAARAFVLQGSSVRAMRPPLRSRAMRENIVRQAPSYLYRARRGASRLRLIFPRQVTAPLALRAPPVPLARRLMFHACQASSAPIPANRHAPCARAESTLPTRKALPAAPAHLDSSVWRARLLRSLAQQARMPIRPSLISLAFSAASTIA